MTTKNTTKMRIKCLALLCALASVPALAGSCKYENIAGRSVQSCSNGFVEVTGPRGVRTFGQRNGGFDRYPSQAAPPWALERGER